MNFLLDTNVISEVRKPRGNTNVKAWMATVPLNSLYLSALLIGELRVGIEQIRRRDQRQAAVLEGWFVSLRSQYADRILPVTADIADEWARMNVPDPVPIIDGLMAATAKVRDLTFVTRDIGDFERRGVRVFNPFTG